MEIKERDTQDRRRFIKNATKLAAGLAALGITCEEWSSIATAAGRTPGQIAASSAQVARPADSQADDPHKMGNRPRPSAGYGKDLGDFKSGIHTMTSAGLERQYTIDIPANYDKNTPYRLIFAMHMLGGHMNTMVNNRFYGMKTSAERDTIPAILLRPRDTPTNPRGESAMTKTIFSLRTCSRCSRKS